MKLQDLQNSAFWFIVGLGLIVAVGFADYYTGYELSFSLFYLIPIGVAAWYSSKKMGFIMSVIATILWFFIDYISDHNYSSAIIPYWNALVRLGIFCIVSYLLPSLKDLTIAREHARIDPLTGAFNRRYFEEVLQNELNRIARNKNPFTLILFDLDGFKNVNDQSGHHVGDQVLCAIVRCVNNLLRKTDLICRLGGDEFAILLFEVNINNVQTAVEKIKTNLLKEMTANKWQITFSMGAVTCQSSTIKIDELIKKADSLMYSIKNNGKNGIAYNFIESDIP